LIDIDDDAAAPAIARAFGNGSSAEIALRGDQHYSSEIEAWTGPPSSVIGLSPDKSYIVTGGLTGLGWQVAQWLVERGAKHLVLVGRRSPTAEVQAVLSAYNARGIATRCASVDIGDADAVSALFDELRSTGPPLAGVVHCAGVVDDGLLLKSSREQLGHVFSSKVDGSVNLCEAMRESSLDLFVLVSSLAAVIGSPTQGAYAAANAFLDCLACHLRSRRGVAAVSIGWGPWSEVGMAAALDRNSLARMADAGLGAMSPRQGLAVLERLLGAVSEIQPHVLAGNIDFRKLAAADAVWAKRSALRAWLADGNAMDTEAGAQLELQALDSPAGQSALRDYLRARVAEILRLPLTRVKIDVPLVVQGFDSLMAVELRNRIERDIGVVIPVVEFLQGPSVVQLRDSIHKRIITANEIVHKETTPEAARESQWEDGCL
jgi:myxalamid-type polyketide synthase MxaE and MxaD